MSAINSHVSFYPMFGSGIARILLSSSFFVTRHTGDIYTRLRFECQSSSPSAIDVKHLPFDRANALSLILTPLLLGFYFALSHCVLLYSSSSDHSFVQIISPVIINFSQKCPHEIPIIKTSTEYNFIVYSFVRFCLALRQIYVLIGVCSCC